MVAELKTREENEREERRKEVAALNTTVTTLQQESDASKEASSNGVDAMTTFEARHTQAVTDMENAQKQALVEAAKAAMVATEAVESEAKEREASLSKRVTELEGELLATKEAHTTALLSVSGESASSTKQAMDMLTAAHDEKVGGV